jgi:hypothetical protein
MIQETLSHKRRPALTSDLWHVVHARWTGREGGSASFSRTIVSEHEDRARAARAAREFVGLHGPQMAGRPAAERDQLFVRKPGFRSLKVAGRIRRRRR